MKSEQLMNQKRGRAAMEDKIPPFAHKMPVYAPNLYFEALDAEPKVFERFSPGNILEDDVCILNQIHRVDFSKMEAIDGEVNNLWLFNLYYGEYLIYLVTRAKREKREDLILKSRDIFKALAESFDRPGIGRAPYVLSLQMVNLVISWNIVDYMKSSMNGKAETWFYADLYRKYKFLQSHTEKHLLANHYFENIKTLLIFAMIFGEEEKVKEYKSLLEAELVEQILPDGMHYERSFMYHKIILEDLIRVYLASQTTPWEPEIKDLVFPYIRKMCIFSDRMESEFSRTPLFNDAGDNVAKPLKTLLKAATLLGAIENSELLTNTGNESEGFAFPHAGYYKQNKGIYSMIVDAGPVGPSYNPGHHQNDCLSFEFFSKKRPVIVNSGCYSYFGNLRAYQRSTAAHNTFMVDDTEQSQCWQSHRVAKRMSDVGLTMEENGFVGHFTDYKGHNAKRTIEFTGTYFAFTDECTDEGTHKITSFLHFEPEIKLEKISDTEVLLIDKKREIPTLKLSVNAGSMEVFADSAKHLYSPEFGIMKVASAVEITGEKVKVTVEENHD